MRRLRFLGVAAIATATALTACRRAPDADPRMVSEWMHTLFGAVRVERMSPPVASRLLAYSTSALYSGLAVGNPRLQPLAGSLNGFPAMPERAPDAEYDGALAAVAAQRVVLDTLLREALPTTRAAFTALADSLSAARAAQGVDSSVRAASADIGRRIGLAIVAWSRADGFDSTRGRPYAVRTGPGLWVNDAPGSTYAAQNVSGATQFVGLDNPANVMRPGTASDRGLILSRPKRAGIKTLPAVNMAGTSEPYWGAIRPFALKTWDECAVPEPPPFSVDTASALWRDAHAVRETRVRLTPEQRQIALYWADNAGESGTPVGHWISIAAQMVSERRLNAEDAARLMVLTAVAQADAFIASWGYKYRYSLIRPRAYIRAAIDSTWEPLIPTPPFPEYPSGHSTQSSAAAAVMTALLGAVPFDDSTGISIGHAARRFPSFEAAADEAGVSRIYGGIHFPYGNSGGKALGQCVGRKVVERLHAGAAR